MHSCNPVDITINLCALQKNLQHTYDLCQAKSIDLAVVAKSVCADEHILKMIEDAPTSILADSRLDNFSCLHTTMKRLLIRPSIPQEAEDVVKHTEISIQSAFPTIQALAEAAKQQNRIHEILLMIDIGDLRDGIYYTEQTMLKKLAAYIHQQPYLRLAGLAANYNCFSHLLPSTENMQIMAELFHQLEYYYNIPSPILSCGNSSAISLLTENRLPIPKEINQFRMGEAIVLGRDPSNNTYIPGYRYDTFSLETALIEVSDKPVNGTMMHRGVLAIGKQDLQIEHLIPKDSRIRILGACSDECVIDLSKALEYQVGDSISFSLEYDALMTLFAGRFIHKKYVYK